MTGVQTCALPICSLAENSRSRDISLLFPYPSPFHPFTLRQASVVSQNLQIALSLALLDANLSCRRRGRNFLSPSSLSSPRFSDQKWKPIRPTSCQLHDLADIDLPEILEEIDLTANCLTKLDERISLLSHLKKLSLRQNSLTGG